MKNVACALPALLLLTGSPAIGQPPSPYLDFKGKHLLVLSDADMLASAYVTGEAGPKTAALRDVLTLVPIGEGTGKRPPVTLPVSNSVKAWPNNLSVTPDGRYALVSELYGPAPDGNTAISATPDGHLLTLIDLRELPAPRVVDQRRLGAKVCGIDVRPQGDLVAVTSAEKGKELALLPLLDGKLGEPAYVRLGGEAGADPAISHVAWHPAGNFLALTFGSGQVQFYRYRAGGARLEPWGNALATGKLPGMGYFTPDGRHYLVTNLFWGDDVEGTFGGSQQGMLATIRFGTESAPDRAVRHSIVSTAATGGSPENFAISPDGRWVVSLDMEQSYFPPDSPLFTPYSALSLFRLHPGTGRLTPVDRYYFDGILPEGITFDASGKYLAVAVFDHHNPAQPGGTLDFWRLLDGDDPKLLKLDHQVPVMRGAHIVKRVD